MSYDLLSEPWLKGRRASGTIEPFAPPGITSKREDPLVDIVAPRADLRASLFQFLIGLLQTALEPDTEMVWKKKYDAPPTPDALARSFEPLRHAFDLQHERTPFMQELGIDDAGDPTIELLFGTPGKNTEKKNSDLFLKRSLRGPLCSSCGASALFCLQTHAIMGGGGGDGYSTSIRGGGPLSTIILGETLWSTCWLNVLPRSDWHPNIPRSEDEKTFPWLAPPATGRRPTITLQDAAIGIHYWALPRRVRLEWSKDPSECRLCGDITTTPIVTAHQRDGGYQYKGSWVHPLTPSRMNKKTGERWTLKGDRSAAGYHHWRGIVFDAEEQDDGRAAPAVAHLRNVRKETLRKYGGWRVEVSGFETNQDKVLGWYQSTLPEITFPDASRRADFEDAVRALVCGSTEAQACLHRAAKAALGSEGRKLAQSEKKFIERQEETFWRATGSSFYHALAALLRDDINVVKRAWRDEVSRAAVDVFRAAFPFASYADVDPARLARAERSLERSLWSPKMTKALEFAQPAEIAA